MDTNGPADDGLDRLSHATPCAFRRGDRRNTVRYRITFTETTITTYSFSVAAKTATDAEGKAVKMIEGYVNADKHYPWALENEDKDYSIDNVDEE